MVELDPSPSWSKIGQGLHGREERVATPQWGWNTENMDPEIQHPSLMGKKLRPSLRLEDLNIGFQEGGLESMQDHKGSLGMQ